jgi:hypothetical protein
MYRSRSLLASAPAKLGALAIQQPAAPFGVSWCQTDIHAGSTGTATGEPGATAPIVTPFNGNQHAGIQVLSTAQFPVNAGPLSHVHR